ncbi:MAG TPA: hypothetical protein PLK06_01940 [bacterium]|nr:hypothetical protein [bacterium]
MDKFIARLGLQKGDWLGVAIVIVLLVGIGAFIAFAPKTEVRVYAPVEVTGSAVVLGEVVVDATSVPVTAEVKQAGFVTVHRAIGEAPGPLIGQSPLLSVGTHADLLVPTTEPISPPGEYFVLLFADDGDGVYESGVDLPVMSDGKVIKEKISL